MRRWGCHRRKYGRGKESTSFQLRAGDVSGGLKLYCGGNGLSLF